MKSDEVVALLYAGAEQARGDVRADVAGNAGQAIHRRRRMDAETDLCGAQGRHFVDQPVCREQGGSAPEGMSGKEVYHRGVARDGCLIYLGRFYVRAAGSNARAAG
jgi:hypothetical protein